MIRHLSANEEELECERREAMARDGTWMPEHTWQYLRPGPIMLEGASRAELVARIEAMTDWTARYLGAERPPPGGSRAARFCPASR